MNILNINNMLLLNSVYSSEKQAKEVVIDGMPLLYFYDGCVSSAEGDIFEAAGKVLFSAKPAEVRQSDLRQARIAGDNKSDISMILLLYLTSLPQDVYDELDISGFSLAFGSRIDSRKYLLYMKDSDILLAAMLHQFLDHRFLANPKDVITLDNLISKLMERMPDVGKGSILLHLFKLYLLGFVNISLTASFDTEKNTQEKQEYLADRFAIASFISDNIAAGKCIRIHSDTSSVNMNCSDCCDMITIKAHFTDILAYTQSVLGVAVDAADKTPCEFDEKSLRLLIFASVKQLHLKLFKDWHNEDKEFHTIELKLQDYIKNLYTYKMSGMDIVDMAILAFLKIRKLPLRELCGKLSQYTEAEIYRSVFAMTLLGVVSPGGRYSDVPEISPYVEKQPVAATTLAPNKSLMGKLLEKIKFK